MPLSSSACGCLRRLGLSIHDGFQYRYVATRRYWRRGQGKKNDRKNRVGFSVSFFLGNRKTDFKKSVFGREKPRKTDRTNQLSIFGSQPWSQLLILSKSHFGDKLTLIPSICPQNWHILDFRSCQVADRREVSSDQTILA